MQDKLDNLPLVSIIIPCYNRAWCIGETINSALAQTYTNREVIVVDDGSTDNTVELVEAYGSRVTLIKKRNGGVSSARNTGIHGSHGELLVFLDSDDLLSPDLLACHVRNSMRWPEVDVYAADSAAIETDGNITIQPCSWPDIPSRPLKLVLLNPPPLIHSQMYRRLALSRVGGFDEAMRYGEDSDLLIRVVLTGGLLTKTNGGYAIYRPSPDSLTRTTGNINYHKSYVMQYHKMTKFFDAGSPEVKKLISTRLDYWRNRFWLSMLKYHWSLQPIELLKLGYYLVRISLVDPGYMVYLLRKKPWLA